MSAPKHTPGKLIEKEYPKVYALVSEAGRQVAILTEHHGDCPMMPMTQFRRSEQDAADLARLRDCWNACEGINPEAVPEMLEALKWVRDNCTGLPAVARALAEKTIAKAEGR